MNSGPNCTIDLTLEELVKEIPGDNKNFLIDRDMFFMIKEDLAYVTGKLEGVLEFMKYTKKESK